MHEEIKAYNDAMLPPDKAICSKQLDSDLLKRWLEKSANIQWDYKNIVKRKGVLERLL